MNFIAIIPARAASTRLPNKPLMDIAGKPMVVRTVERAIASGAKQVLVATDTPAILEAVRAHGYDALLTRTDHLTGTDRLAEAIDTLALDDNALVVNVQGDEPCIAPSLIQAVAQLLATRPEAAIATCATPITTVDALFNPDIVKVVLSTDQRAIYFSRAPIPWARDALAAGTQCLATGLPAWHHIGLYAYRAHFLRKFPTLSRGLLEHYESLEQLRALEHGYSIVVHPTPSAVIAGVDTLEDLIRTRDFYAQQLKESYLKGPHHPH